MNDMRYYLDTEFYEYQKKPLFGKAIDTIELISIGMVSEDINNYIGGIDPIDEKSEVVVHNYPKSREYYAICKEFDLKAAWYANQGSKEEPDYWLRENVLKPIWLELKDKQYNETSQYGDHSPIWDDSEFTLKGLRRLINKYGKTKKQIANDIVEFCVGGAYDVHRLSTEGKSEFYAYYNSYDWVAFCQLFGGLMKLPKGFPHFCYELAELEVSKRELVKGLLKNHKDYPKNNNAHDALSDAKWNKELHKFLNEL